MRNKENRQSNYELLRIIAIIMIISSHLVVHSNISFDTEVISINRFWTQFISSGGKVGFNLFVIISGYFLYSAQNVKISKVLKIILQTTFYSLIIYFALVFLKLQKFQLVQAIKSLFPIAFSTWGFASAYFVIYLLFPFINILLKSLSQKQHIYLLILMFVIWSIIPTFTSVSFQCNYVSWMFFLYSIGAYIRKYYRTDSKQKTKWLLLSVISVLSIFFSAVILDLIGLKYPSIGMHAGYFYGGYRFPSLLAAVFIFLFFCCIEFKTHNWVNRVASLTFGIYLIHDNPYLREILWSRIIDIKAMKDFALLIPYTMLAIVSVFIICGSIEALRIVTIEKRYIKLIDCISNKVDNTMELLIDKIASRSVDDK